MPEINKLQREQIKSIVNTAGYEASFDLSSPSYDKTSTLRINSLTFCAWDEEQIEFCFEL